MAETIDPTVLAQLAAVAPNLRAAASDADLARRFNDAAQRLTWHWLATTFHIEDSDVAEAAAVWSQRSLGGSVRRDEIPFFVVTAAIDWGWNWRAFEFGDNEIPEADPVDWVESRLPLTMAMLRSERLGVIAQKFCADPDELSASTIGLAAHGEAVVEASFLLFKAWNSERPQGRPHGVQFDLLREAYRFGIALRTSALALDAYDEAAGGAGTVVDEPLVDEAPADIPLPDQPVVPEPFTDPAAVRDAERQCPDCAETIKAEARVCRFCGYRFAPPL